MTNHQTLAQRIARVNELDAGRTQGEWRYSEHDEPANNGDDSEYNWTYWVVADVEKDVCNVLDGIQEYQLNGPTGQDHRDLRFIAHASTMPALIRDLCAVIVKQREAAVEARRWIDPIDNALADSVLHGSLALSEGIGS